MRNNIKILERKKENNENTNNEKKKTNRKVRLKLRNDGYINYIYVLCC